MTLSKPLREVNGLCFFVGFQHVPLLSHGHLIAIRNIDAEPSLFSKYCHLLKSWVRMSVFLLVGGITPKTH